MSETTSYPNSEERVALEGVRAELVAFNEQIFGKAIEAFEAIQPFEDFKRDPSWEPRWDSDKGDNKTYYYLDSRWALASSYSKEFEGKPTPLERHDAVRVSLGYEREEPQLPRGSGFFGEANTMLDNVIGVLNGSEARSFRQTIIDTEGLPRPQKIGIALRVVGTGDPKLDAELGDITLTDRTISGYAIPLHAWGTDIAYPENLAELKKFATLQGHFLTEQMIETQEERMLGVHKLLTGIVDVAKDTDLNPRS